MRRHQLRTSTCATHELPTLSLKTNARSAWFKKSLLHVFLPEHNLARTVMPQLTYVFCTSPPPRRFRQRSAAGVSRRIRFKRVFTLTETKGETDKKWVVWDCVEVFILTETDTVTNVNGWVSNPVSVSVLGSVSMNTPKVILEVYKVRKTWTCCTSSSYHLAMGFISMVFLGW